MPISAVQAKKENEGAITPQNQLQIVKQWGEAFNNLVETQHVLLTPVEKEFGMSIITNLTNRCIQGGIKPSELNMTDFLEQVKHYSKLQLSINEQELYLDIRNNKDTGLKTVRISRQYQGIQKLMTRYCTKKIVRFMHGIVCNTDTFVVEEDFALGITVIRKHNKDASVNRNDFKNIKAVYVIAYAEEHGQLVPYTVIVDKERIVRARNAATTDKIWQSDMQKMIIKTGYWNLWAFMKPYIELPLGIQESLMATEDEMDFDKPTPVGVDTIQIYGFDDSPKDEKKTKSEIVVDASTGEVIKPSDDFQSIDDVSDEIVIPYSEYRDNKDKFEKIAYDEATKTVRVRRK